MLSTEEDPLVPHRGPSEESQASLHGHPQWTFLLGLSKSLRAHNRGKAAQILLNKHPVNSASNLLVLAAQE